jgi:hypothetical protein
MPKIRLHPIVINIIIAFVFFAVGRLVVIQLGDIGIWIIVISVIVFYAIWWVRYQRSKRK